MNIVIGGSGYIGRNLCKHFSEKNELLIGTYYQHKKEGLSFFDLSNPDLKKLDIDLKKARNAFICSSICNIDRCKTEEKEAYKINVEGIEKIISQCFDLDLFPVFFSSDNVFNGKKGNYTEEDETNPCNVYGTHKKIIEDFLLNSRENFLVARLSMIYGTQERGQYFEEIIGKLKKGLCLRQATDQKLTPTHIDDLVNILDISIQRGLKGLYNIAASGIYSRFELSKLIKSRLEICSGMIIPCSIKDFKFADNRPLDMGLNNAKIMKETGYRFIPVEKALKKLKERKENGIWS
jgi:dTDP-4-dehydrorhamnose reductase